MIRVSEELNGDPEVLVVRGNFVGVHVADKLASSRDEFLEYIQMISAQGVAVGRQYDPSPPFKSGVSNLWVLGVSPPSGGYGFQHLIRARGYSML